MTKSDHFVENATQRPNIRFLVVRFLLANFWRKVVRSSNGSLSTVVGVLQHTRDAEISDLDGSVLVHENVLSLQVSVQNFSVVDVLDGQRHLHKPVENLVFAVADFADFLLVGNLGL